MKVSIIGASTTTFGELWDVSPRALAREVVIGAMKDAGIMPQDIGALFVGNMLSGMLGSQEHLGAFFAEELGFHGAAAFKIEGACASGSLALHNAVNAIISGQYETVAVLGVEKMTDHRPEDVATALMGAGSSQERAAGCTFPGLYAILARVHMQEYGTTREDLAAVAVKNHFHASLNPHSQFKKPITMEAVLRSHAVADPLTLLDCSPISDGAAALVLTSDKRQATRDKKPISIIASCVSTDSLGLAQRDSLTELKATKDAATRAYKIAALSVKDIDLIELHDCFTIAELLALEDLGVTKKGDAAGLLRRGAFTLGRAPHVVVNPSGGLKGCGHPIGATGVKQVVEIVEQLRGAAGARQVSGARVGLAHNVGGTGATAVVHILAR
ncbi:MAG: thiolase domain-containing protein [Candidatus Gottesmanbacteria bacterium]|nr:thiolase domain-containing protein [Candidatus Gottesmanbacteria bacterium]